MSFKRGKYDFLILPECGPAYDSAVDVLERLGTTEDDFDLGLRRIHAAVQQGKLPSGARIAKREPRRYRVPVHGIQIYFSVDQTTRVVTIDEIDDESRAKEWLASRAFSGSQA